MSGSSGLAGGLARAAAIDSAAVPLALTLAMVGDEKFPARHALALSRLGHRRSPNEPVERDDHLDRTLVGRRV
jgi:hypothetical protein